MALASYADLKTAITNFTKRSDLSNYLDDFVTLAEGRLQGEIRSRDMEQRTTSALDSTTPYISLPTDFLLPRLVFLTNGGVIKQLSYMTPEALLFSHINASTQREPQHYTIVGDEMRFGAWPDSAYTVEIWYYKRLAAISGTIPTLFTNNPDLYLAASLVEAFKFIKDEARATFWEAKYQAAKARVNTTEEDGRRGSGMQAVVM